MPLDPDPAAARLSRLAEVLRAERDAGCPEALSLREQRAWRAGFNRALMLLGSCAFDALSGPTDR